MSSNLQKSSVILKVEEELRIAELNFINSVETLIECFQTPFENFCHELFHNPKAPKEVIDLLDRQNAVHSIFYELPAHLELANASSLSLQSGKLTLTSYFLSFQDKIELMANYEANLEKSRNTASVLRGEHLFWGFFRACEMIAATRSWSSRLDDYIILPTQRLQRYKNILTRFLDDVPEESNDNSILMDALDVVHDLAFKVSEYRSKILGKDKMPKVQEAFNLKNLDNGFRYFVKDGDLLKACADGK